MAVVKADAYGHGAAEVCAQLEQADAFAVARTSEGVELRNAGISHPIVVLEGFTDNQGRHSCGQYNLLPVIHSEYQLTQLDEQMPAWLKVNTGMFRLGFSQTQVDEYLTVIQQKNFVGVMSHLANSEDVQRSSNQRQLDLFDRITHAISMNLPCSLAGSGGILGLPKTHKDWVRPGVMLYGGSPSAKLDSRLKAAMTLSASIIAVNELDIGDAIGYGSIWKARERCRVAVVGLGYGDGYPREMPEGTPVLLNQRRRRIVGRISMDMCFVELDRNDEARPGDRVIFWGEDLPIDEIAAQAGSISYALMTGLTNRVTRVYQGGESIGKK